MKKDFIENGLSASKTKDTDKARKKLKKQLTELSNSDNYADAVNEWIFEDYKYRVGSKCACGQTIDHNYILRNKVNGNLITVGSKCIQKYFIDRPDLTYIINSVNSTHKKYEDVLKKYGKLVDNHYMWTEDSKVTITELDKNYNYYDRRYTCIYVDDVEDVVAFDNCCVWDIPKDFGRIIRVLMDFDEKHEVFNKYEIEFLDFIIRNSYYFTNMSEKQQNFFIKLFNEKVMPILYDWYGPVVDK